MTNNYDYIIIGAGRKSPSSLTLLPRGEGDAPRKNKALFYQQGLKRLF